MSIVHVFPKDEDDGVWIHPVLMMPKKSIKRLSKRDGVTYDEFARDGHLNAIPGIIIQDTDIEKVLLQSNSDYDIAYIEYDKKYMYKLMARLDEEHNINVSPFTQSAENFTSPLIKIESQVLLQKLNAGDNPLLTSHVMNVEIVRRNDVVAIDRSVRNVRATIAMAMGGYETDTSVSKISKYNIPS